jgi:hypothetical protein
VQQPRKRSTPKNNKPFYRTGCNESAKNFVSITTLGAEFGKQKLNFFFLLPYGT